MSASTASVNNRPAVQTLDRNEPPPGLLLRIRRAAAYFWIGFFMISNVERSPRLGRLTRPFFLFFAWRTSITLRTNLMLNARRLLGDNSSTAQRRHHSKAVMRNFYDFIVDICRTKHMTDAELEHEVALVRGLEQYYAARAQYTGAILVTAHLGSFEIGMASLGRIEPHVHVVFRRDPMPRFERLRRAQRERLGVIEAPVDDGLDVWFQLRDALGRNEVVLMQGDRVMVGQKGQRVPFLGGHMMMPTGPVKLALASGAPIIPIFAPRCRDHRVQIILEDPIIVSADGNGLSPHDALHKLGEVIEKYVKRYPDQWLVVHRALCEDESPGIAQGAPG